MIAVHSQITLLDGPPPLLHPNSMKSGWFYFFVSRPGLCPSRVASVPCHFLHFLFSCNFPSPFSLFAFLPLPTLFPTVTIVSCIFSMCRLMAHVSFPHWFRWNSMFLPRQEKRCEDDATLHGAF
jgi:hypothetical protein